MMNVCEVCGHLADCLRDADDPSVQPPDGGVNCRRHHGLNVAVCLIRETAGKRGVVATGNPSAPGGISESVTLDETVALLNRMLAADPDATRRLLATRVPCNRALADDPTIQVGALPDGGSEVGLLGVINGLFGVDECFYGGIYVEGVADGSLVGFFRSPGRHKED